MIGAALTLSWILSGVMLAPAAGHTVQARIDPSVATASWEIVAASGRSESRPGMSEQESWSPLKRGAALAPLTLVRTLEKARATFTRNGDLILMDAESEVLLPEITPAGMTVVIQKSGSALYKVAPGSATRRFEVRTPYLVAGVKGTRFTVQMEDGRAAVNVLEGVVEVRSLLTGETQDLGAGETALVDGHQERMEMQRDLSGKLDRSPDKQPESAPLIDEPVLVDLRSTSLELDTTLQEESNLLGSDDRDLWSDLSDGSMTLIDAKTTEQCTLPTRLDPTSQDVKTDQNIINAVPLLSRRN